MRAWTDWETLVVVGAGAAGMAAAGRVRRLSPKKRIIILDQSPLAPVGTCGLPYLLSGEVEHPGLLVLEHEPTLELRCSQQVTGFDWKAQRLEIRCLESQRCTQVAYDRLLLAPGGGLKGLARVAEATRLHSNVFVPRNLTEMIRLQAYLDQAAPRRALVVGGGYIGIEMAEVLAKRGLTVTLVEQKETLMGLDPWLHAHLVKLLNSQGIGVMTSQAIEFLSPQAPATRLPARMAVTSEGHELEFDIAVLATGISPAHPLLTASGLALRASGAVRVDSHLATSQPNVWAAGDCIEVEHAVLGQPVHLPLARLALLQGLAVADKLLGVEQPSSPPRGLGTLALRLFGQEMAVTGLSRAAAHSRRRECRSIELTVPTRASYYSGGGQLHLAIVAEKQGGRLLGAQALGAEGATQVINIIAQAILQGREVDSLGEFETAYQPSLSSLWDPLHLAKRMWPKEDRVGR